MFKKRRIRKLTERIAGLNKEAMELERVVHGSVDVPLRYVDQLLRIAKISGTLEKRLELLTQECK